MNNKTSDLSHLLFSGYNKQKYTEAEILEGIIKKSDKMYRFIYHSYFPGIKAMVNGFQSLVLDADDIFQDGLVAASINVMANKFKGESTFYTYLTSICRNICWKQLERKRKTQAAVSNQAEADEIETDVEELIRRLTCLKDKMDEKCKQIIDLRFGLAKESPDITRVPNSVCNVRFEEIASVLKIEPDNARQRFKRCLEKLRSVVFNDRAWIEILAT